MHTCICTRTAQSISAHTTHAHFRIHTHTHCLAHAISDQSECLTRRRTKIRVCTPVRARMEREGGREGERGREGAREGARRWCVTHSSIAHPVGGSLSGMVCKHASYTHAFMYMQACMHTYINTYIMPQTVASSREPAAADDGIARGRAGGGGSWAAAAVQYGSRRQGQIAWSARYS
jgi:hypothetical protein